MIVFLLFVIVILLVLIAEYLVKNGPQRPKTEWEKRQEAMDLLYGKDKKKK